MSTMLEERGYLNGRVSPLDIKKLQFEVCFLHNDLSTSYLKQCFIHRKWLSLEVALLGRYLRFMLLEEVTKSSCMS